MKLTSQGDLMVKFQPWWVVMPQANNFLVKGLSLPGASPGHCSHASMYPD